MILVNGQPDNTINVSDRGLQYGDGLFETMLFKQGRVEFLDKHLERLESGAQRLFINIDSDLIRLELTQLCQQLTDDYVIKLIITRGQGGRGYKATEEMLATRIISVHPLPVYPEANQTGIKVCICHTRMGCNPALAGIKHLNRLEQVLARNEWGEPDIYEGLMFDFNENLIEGTMSNVFLVKSGQLYTADLSLNGVEGIMRHQIIEIAEANGVHVNILPLTMNDLINADEVFISNSLFRIWPVTEITSPSLFFKHGPITQQLQKAILTDYA